MMGGSFLIAIFSSLDDRWFFNVNCSPLVLVSFFFDTSRYRTGVVLSPFILVYDSQSNAIPPSLISISLALTSPHTVGGVLSLSTWLPLLPTFPQVSIKTDILLRQNCNQREFWCVQALVAGDKKANIPILQCHGRSTMKLTAYLTCWCIGNQDPIIDLKRSRLSEESFKAMGFKGYVFKEYDGLVHTNCEQVRTSSVLSQCQNCGNGIFDVSNVRYLPFTVDMGLHCRMQLPRLHDAWRQMSG
jgi:hypothetical protein